VARLTANEACPMLAAREGRHCRALYLPIASSKPTASAPLDVPRSGTGCRGGSKLGKARRDSRATDRVLAALPTSCVASPAYGSIDRRTGQARQ
jgi:hypothetical protein